MALQTNKQNKVFYFCERKHIDKGPEGEGGRVEVLNLVLADRVERSFPVDLELGLAEPWDLHHHVERLQEKNLRRRHREWSLWCGTVVRQSPLICDNHRS